MPKQKLEEREKFGMADGTPTWCPSRNLFYLFSENNVEKHLLTANSHSRWPLTSCLEVLLHIPTAVKETQVGQLPFIRIDIFTVEVFVFGLLE